MIDPLTQLAFSVHANEGVFAVLLGSGVSRSAAIPTGWEVTLDLILKVARAEGEDCDPQPEVWYEGKYGEQPDYSNLLARLDASPTERQSLLRGYFEPTDEEREEDEKQPTVAHRAIARLASASGGRRKHNRARYKTGFRGSRHAEFLYGITPLIP